MRLRSLLFALATLLAVAPAAAQNPVTIAKVGTANVTTTVPVSGTVTANQGTSGAQGWLVQGLVAHDATYSGNPIGIGCYASATPPSDVSGDGDMAHVWCLRNGALAVNFTNTTIAVTQATAANLNATVVQGTATNLKTQAENYQGGTAVGAANPLQVSLANTGANATAIKVDGTGGTFPVTQSTSPWIVAGGGTAGAPGTAVLTIQGIGSGTAVAISAASLPLPTGASTLAEQQTQTTSLQLIDDGISTTGSAVPAKGFQATGTDGTNARALKTDSGGELQVDVLTAPNQKQVFGATPQTVINTGSDIAAGNFSGAPSATYDNTNDGTAPQAIYALAVGQFPDWAAAPVAGTVVDLYGVILDVDGTSDETDAPSGSSAGGAHYFGSWTIAAADALQRRAIVIKVQGYQKIDFYIRNGTAQNMNNDGGTNATVKITPLTQN